MEKIFVVTVFEQEGDIHVERSYYFRKEEDAYNFGSKKWKSYMMNVAGKGDFPRISAELTQIEKNSDPKEIFRQSARLSDSLKYHMPTEIHIFPALLR
jgi:hypothetical protein